MGTVHRIAIVVGTIIVVILAASPHSSFRISFDFDPIHLQNPKTLRSRPIAT